MSIARALPILLWVGFVFGMAFPVAAQPPATPAYPLKVSPNHRYLVDQNDVPFMIVGDSPQGLITDLSTAEAATYFANRAAYGFNAVQIHLLCQETFGGRGDYSTYDGITPFTTPGDISTPRESYFARVDAMLNLAAQHGIVVYLTAAETIDSLDLFRSNGETKSRAFGQYLGNRYKNFDNIVWVYGNDFQTWETPSDNAVILAVANGVRDMDSRHLHTAWLDYFVSASRDSPDWAALVNLDLAYTYYPTYAKVLSEYALSPAMPVFMGEANYEEESISVPLTTPEIIRRQEYWAMTSGATGSFYGNYWTWPFRAGWQDHYDSPGAAQMPHFKNLFQTRNWWELVPDITHQVLTAGYGTYEEFGNVHTSDYATAALAAESSVMIAYLPSIRTVTVDMSKLSGPVTAQWYDPSNGIYSTVADSPFPNTGTRQFTPTGNNNDGNGDWVLLLESESVDTTPPQISSVTVSALTDTSALITWMTNESADSQVEYGLTTAYGSTTVLDTALVTSHTAVLTGLTSITTYHYRVKSRDAAGNLSTSGDLTFTITAVGLVAAYAFDEGMGLSAMDGSGNGLTGVLTNGAAWNIGKYGDAVQFDGSDDYVDLGNPAPLQLTGSMTISAWIKPSAFPVDDAAVVSKRSAAESGYQLDTTVDQGPRTIGFKLTSSAAQPMFRYGATTLQTNMWYHIAGVYNAAAQTLDVYLNGQLDNGVLLGTVTTGQQNSTANVHIGRRAGPSGFEFAGLIDDVRIYNRALTPSEIQSDLNTPVGADTTPPMISEISAAGIAATGASITWTTNEPADSQVEYGLTTAYGLMTTLDPALTIAHTVALTGLTDNTIYHYRVNSRDLSGNLATSVDLTFTTAKFKKSVGQLTSQD